MLRRIVRWVGALFGRRRMEREMSAEMAHHLELEIEDRVARGMSPAEARRTALRDFGGVERWKEASREARGLSPLDELRQDATYAFRSLRSAPGFATVAILTLALGIGATTAIYTVVDGLLLEPLGLDRPDRIVRLLEHRAGEEDSRGTTSYPNFHDWLDQSESLVMGAVYDEYAPTLSVDGRAVKVPAGSVNASYFDVLGVRPAAGRFFLPEEDEGGSSRVVLSWGLWRDMFGADPSVVGRVIDLSGFPYTVVGVAEPFEDPQLQGLGSDAPRLWRSTPSYFATNGRGGRSFTGIARLAPGVTVDAAQAELSAIHDRLVAEYPAENADRVVEVVPLKDTIVGDVGPVLWILMGAVGLVLLIACANVANLLLFRAAGRTREISLRTALGASRGRVVRQLLTESSLLALLGAGAGVVVAIATTRGLLALAAGQLPRADNVSIDPGVLGFTVAVAGLAAILFGLVPALHAADEGAGAGLKEGGRGSAGSRSQGALRGAVVAAEVALAVVVLLGAGLLTRSLLVLQGVDPGVAAEQTLTLRIDPPYDPYGPTDEDGGARLSALYTELTDRVESVPGVESAALVDILPMSGSFNGNAFRFAGEPEPEPGRVPNAETRAVGPGYFETHGVPLVEGRTFEPRDGLDAPKVAVANVAWTRRYDLTDAVGTRIHVFDPEAPPFTVVGVVGDVAQFSLGAPPEPTLYFPIDQAPTWMRTEPFVIVRAAGGDGRRADPGALASAVRDAISAVDPRIPIYSVAPMTDVVSATLARPRFRTLVLLGFAAIAFLLATIGVYGMVAYSVASRRQEIGVRMALGADPPGIRRLVVAQGIRPVLLGSAIGLAIGVAAVQLLRGLLFGVSATDPLTLIGAPAILTLVAVMAAWLPAMKAARTAPSTVLRSD